MRAPQFRQAVTARLQTGESCDPDRHGRTHLAQNFSTAGILRLLSVVTQMPVAGLVLIAGAALIGDSSLEQIDVPACARSPGCKNAARRRAVCPLFPCRFTEGYSNPSRGHLMRSEDLVVPLSAKKSQQARRHPP